MRSPDEPDEKAAHTRQITEDAGARQEKSYAPQLAANTTDPWRRGSADEFSEAQQAWLEAGKAERELVRARNAGRFGLRAKAARAGRRADGTADE